MTRRASARAPTARTAIRASRCATRPAGETIATELEATLRDAGVDDVVVVGLATDYCVKATALDAARLGFTTHVLADAIAAVNLEPGDGERALGEIRRRASICGGPVMTVTR